MKVTYLPVLGVLRGLYAQPRTMQRFHEYILTLTGGTDDVVLPIGVANPMAKEHALTKLDELLALGAEAIGAEAAAVAEARLAPLAAALPALEVRASIVLADDLGGGWTNRYTTEAMTRFPSRGALKRPFATALAWTSEAVRVEQLRQDVLMAIYRVVYQQRRGLPSSLGQRMEQEGLGGVFADSRPDLSYAQLDAARETIRKLGADPPYPQVFAALYGDEAAAQLGYTPLGLPPRAGFDLALADALAQQRDPVLALLAVGTGQVQDKPERHRHHTAKQHRNPRH